MRVVQGEHRGGELKALPVDQRPASQPKGGPRLEPSLEICPQGVASQCRARQRVAPVPACIAEHDRHLPRRQDEHVIEVATGCRTIGCEVSGGDGQSLEPTGNGRHERQLHGLHVFE